MEASNRNLKTALEQTHWAPTNLTTTPEGEDKLMQKMQISIAKLKKSGFFAAFLNQIRNSEASFHFHRVTESEHKLKMVIYGIGSIESSKSSELQLSLAILMKKEVDWIGDVEVFDPIISLTELKVIEELGCCVLSVNEWCQREAVNPILFFMPRCRVTLFENLLKTNWRHGMLNRIIILGNSFKHQKNYRLKHLCAIQPFTKEFEISNLSEAYIRAAFGGLSWHFFSVGCEANLKLTC
ncbi:unnamed protein product [Lactuca saligna]|uniref:SRR1-like domain-containing protein n=1 Tax=Lactuca saligna TaxID=75948 RepID=A0AA35V5U0_LACSI|nr:unnamed protein product [Lactuca saligna]